ncbi:MAG: hypothetical protein Q9226_000290 [Calogaya cf. arnoldii]
MSSEHATIHCHQKRELDVEETPGLTALPTTKRQKLDHDQRGRNFPPAFWDSLSRLFLTTRSLREFDRRTLWPSTPVRPQSTGAEHIDLSKLVQFAEEPDLDDLRAYLGPKDANVDQEAVSSQTMSDDAAGTSAYDPAFQQHMIDHGCMPRLYPSSSQSVMLQPQNFAAIAARLERPRASSSALTQKDFTDFLDQNTKAVNENTTMSTEIRTIAGESDILSLQDVLFNRLEPLIKIGAEPLFSQPRVDLYDGNDPSDLAKSIRDSLGGKNGFIVPCEDTDRPCLPNFFLEAKGKKGDSMVVMRQGWYDGCLGARGVHELRAWIDPDTLDDNNAYTLVCTYEAGTATLVFYTVHLRRSKTPHYRRISSMPTRRYEYRMSIIYSVSMLDGLTSFARGMRLYQNARDWAKEQRDQLCAAANAKASALKAASASRPQGSEDELA